MSQRETDGLSRASVMPHTRRTPFFFTLGVNGDQCLLHSLLLEENILPFSSTSLEMSTRNRYRTLKFPYNRKRLYKCPVMAGTICKTLRRHKLKLYVLTIICATWKTSVIICNKLRCWRHGQRFKRTWML